MFREDRGRRWEGPKRSIVAGEVGRAQNHLAEHSVRRLADLMGAGPGLQVVQDGFHDAIAPREDRMTDEVLDPFDDGRFKTHGESISMKSKDGFLGVPTGSKVQSNSRANPAGRWPTLARHALGGCGHTVAPGPICLIPQGVRTTFLAGQS